MIVGFEIWGRLYWQVTKMKKHRISKGRKPMEKTITFQKNSGMEMMQLKSGSTDL